MTDTEKGVKKRDLIITERKCHDKSAAVYSG
jgi:hypothetical protein